MQTSTDRILTTHTGSIARPDDLIELMRARENGLPYDADAFEARAKAAVVRRCLALVLSSLTWPGISVRVRAERYRGKQC